MRGRSSSRRVSSSRAGTAATAEPSGLATTKSTPVWFVTAAGPVRIDGAGGAVVSTVQTDVPGWAGLPAASDADTTMVCEPSLTGLTT